MLSIDKWFSPSESHIQSITLLGIDIVTGGFTDHSLSEGRVMLKSRDNYHSIADDEPIPKIYFYQNRSLAFSKKLFCV